MNDDRDSRDVDNFFRSSGEQQTLEEVHRGLDQLRGLPSPWFDAPRSRWLIIEPDQIHDTLIERSHTNRLSGAKPGTRSATLLARLGNDDPPMLFTDAPEHTAIRRAIAPRFRSSELRNATVDLKRDFANRLAGQPDGSPFDLAVEVVLPAVTTMILERMEFETSGPAEFNSIVSSVYDVNRLFDLESTEAVRERGQAARGWLRTYLQRELARQADLGIGVGASWNAAGISIGSQLATAESVVRAGVVNCSSLLLNAVHLCQVDPNWAPNPWGLSESQLERLMILASPVLDAGRVTQEETRLGDQTIGAGETLICMLGAAAREYTEPAAVGEVVPSPLLFGGGRHVCLGSWVTRAAFGALFEVLPGLSYRLMPAGRPLMHGTPSFRGLHSLPVTKSYSRE